MRIRSVFAVAARWVSLTRCAASHLGALRAQLPLEARRPRTQLLTDMISRVCKHWVRDRLREAAGAGARGDEARDVHRSLITPSPEEGGDEDAPWDEHWDAAAAQADAAVAGAVAGAGTEEESAALRMRAVALAALNSIFSHSAPGERLWTLVFRTMLKVRAGYSGCGQVGWLCKAAHATCCFHSQLKFCANATALTDEE